MKLHYMGKYNLNPDSLPHKPHKPGAVPFKEEKDFKTFALKTNVLAILLFIPLAIILYLRCGNDVSKYVFWGYILSLLLIFPHELLHAIVFKEDVFLYTSLKHGMLFIVGPETMSKVRFICMSILPNLILGFIPYIFALIIPFLSILGVSGAILISMGAGDYYNIINAATQMPKGARTYLYQFNSFWYIPDDD